MKCPNCGGELGINLTVKCVPIAFTFIMQATPDGQWRRATEIAALEMFNLEEPGKGTHFVTCSGCSAEIDITTIPVVPVCMLCHKEKKLTKVANSCFYEGLVCVDCARKRLVREQCPGCNKRTKCALFNRASKPDDESST